jgi:predicted ABC-type ATPase
MPTDKPVLIVIAGPNGSGKTELTRILRSAYDWARITDRAYFVDNSRDVENPSSGMNPLTIFRTANGVVAKSYMKEQDFPHWVGRIYQALQLAS